MESNPTRPEPEDIEAAEQDNIAERLKQLEEEAERLRQQLKEEQNKAAEESANDTKGSEPKKQVTPQDVEEAERLVRQAHLAKSRQEHSKALDLLRQAEQVAPDSIDVLLELGDNYAAKNRWKEAQAAYGRATRLKPQDVAIERKYAEAVLKANLPIEALYGMNRLAVEEQIANANVASLISFLIPGVGQMVLGDNAKGIAFLTVWLGSWVAAVLIPNGISGIVELASGKPNAQVNLLVLLPLALALIMNLASMYDAKATGTRFKKPKPDRPKPPVDLPFE